jgi:hypothetical protein
MDTQPQAFGYRAQCIIGLEDRLAGALLDGDVVKYGPAFQAPASGDITLKALMLRS